MAYILKEKLKDLKGLIRGWSQGIYGSADFKIGNLIQEINALDIRSEANGLSDNEVALRKQLFLDLWHLNISKVSVLAQRARLKWLRKGDANSRYFHATIKFRGKKNFIRALRVGDVWLESSLEIRQATVLYFKQHFSSVMGCRPTLDGIHFPALLDEDNLRLTRPFGLGEIEAIVKASDGSKSPGPDGFNFAFIKEFWSILKGEIHIMFDQFHGIGSLPKSFSSYFVALIPKINSPFSLGDFRPISLLGCLYKILAKVLTARLANVMDRIVATTQSAFLKGRQLVDGVVVINEVVNLAKRTGKSCLILKVDFEKAYDSVEWCFLDYMLGRFGFCAQWRGWIRACVFSGSMSILINGCPSEEINIQRGLKQGDPLAPFLFLLVAEGLGGLMRKAVELNRFKGLKLAIMVLVCHIFNMRTTPFVLGKRRFLIFGPLKRFFGGLRWHRA
jgi:hypothetical protein